MSKFKVGDKVYRLEDRKEANILWEVSSVKVMKGGDKEYHNYVLKAEGIGSKFLGSNNNNGSRIAFVNFDDDLELYKTPHERLVELGFIGQEPFSGDYRLYKKGTFINIVIISFNIKDKDYVIWKQDDEVSIKEFYPVNLELAEVLVDYLKELENE